MTGRQKLALGAVVVLAGLLIGGWISEPTFRAAFGQAISLGADKP